MPLDVEISPMPQVKELFDASDRVVDCSCAAICASDTPFLDCNDCWEPRGGCRRKLLPNIPAINLQMKQNNNILLEVVISTFNAMHGHCGASFLQQDIAQVIEDKNGNSNLNGRNRNGAR